MGKYVLLSLMLAPFALPFFTAKGHKARRSLRRLVVSIVLFEVVFALIVVFYVAPAIRHS